MANRSKAKGTSFETLIKNYLNDKGFKKAHRTALTGGDDAGDIHGIERPDGHKAILQCKNHKKYDLSGWLDDTVEQAARANDAVPALVVKRAGKGEKAVGDSYVVMRLSDFVELLGEADYS
jgi:hypothetical protein